ncbi:MAG: hypothetical protein KAT32_04865 [Candidatus Moranbacteria bacterium]|nr:hypothetical protein [Candidatus Moranbacteria bacterium]
MSEKNKIDCKTKQMSDEGLKFLAEQLIKIYEIQSNDFDKFDQKMSWFLIFQSAIFIHFLDKHNIFLLSLLFLNIGLCCYILYPRKIRTPYSSKNILDNFWKEDDVRIKDAQAQIVVDLNDAIEENKNVIKSKTGLSKWVIGMFLFVIFLSILKHFLIIKMYIIL